MPIICDPGKTLCKTAVLLPGPQPQVQNVFGTCILNAHGKVYRGLCALFFKLQIFVRIPFTHIIHRLSKIYSVIITQVKGFIYLFYKE